MGAILLNVAMDKCLLVRGYKDSASWGFPKGKVAKEESDRACAIREVGMAAAAHALRTCMHARAIGVPTASEVLTAECCAGSVQGSVMSGTR